MPIKRFLTKLTIITTVVGAPIAGGFLGKYLADASFNNKQKEIQNQERFNGVSDLMLNNGYNTPITIDVDKNKPINVSLFNFTDEERKDAINAINDLDEISENINYNILENNHSSVSQKITISKIPRTQLTDMTKDPFVLGFASIKYSVKDATIMFPVNIYINENISDVYNKNGVSVLSYVLKHEMMHSLGFKDMYTDDYLNKTVMYYQVSQDVEISNYTEFDKKNIKQVYDYTTTTLSEQYKNGNIKVEYPNFLQTFYDNKKKIKNNLKEDDFTL